MGWQHTHYQIGAIALRVRTDAPELLTDFNRLLEGSRVLTPPRRPLAIEVRSRRRRGRVTAMIRSPGTRPRVVETGRTFLPALLAYLDQLVIQRCPDLFILHAAAVERGGVAVVLPAGSGTGKSTLAAALLVRGWRYLTDELTLIDPLTLQVHPFPRPLSIKQTGFDLVRSMGLRFSGDRTYAGREGSELAFCSAFDVRPGAVGTSCPLRWLLFLHRPDSAQPASLKAMPAGQAAMYCYGIGLNTLAHRRHGVDIVRRAAAAAQCRWLFVGDVQSTCALLESALPQGEDGSPAELGGEMAIRSQSAAVSPQAAGLAASAPPAMAGGPGSAEPAAPARGRRRGKPERSVLALSACHGAAAHAR